MNNIPKRKKEVVIIDNLEPGELELRKVFEEVMTRNIRTITDFSQDTRKIVRDLEDRLDRLDKLIQQKDNVIAELKTQLTAVQTKVYQGGT